MAPTLGLHRGEAASDRRIAALSLALGRAGHSSEELRPEAAPFAVSYIAGTVFDDVARPCYVIELHVLRTDVSYGELQTLVTRVREASDELTATCGGDPDAFTWASVSDR